MAPQHVEIAETIAAIKRTLRREKEAPTDQNISSATNRGNKLRRGASSVHAGALPYPHGPDGYKEKIDHAGYSRYVLDRNPKRYNEYGDELEDSESDAEADADAEDENPYSGIKLEELLCPLKHPSELASHPTLSIPFLDSALPDLVVSVETKLRQERANLWRAKNLNRQFMGDEPWVPCASVEGLDDWDIFEPKLNAPLQPAGSKRKRDHDQEMSQNGINGHDHAIANDLITRQADSSVEVNVEAEAEAAVARRLDRESEAGPKAPPVPEASTKEQAEREMDDVPAKIEADQSQQARNSSDEQTEQDPAQENDKVQKENGDDEMQVDQNEEAKDARKEPKENEAGDESASEEEEEEEQAEQPQPTRRITRALAAEHTTSTITSPPLSPNSTASTVDSSLLQADPLFLLPPSLAANHRVPNSLSRLGLPVEEFLETRRLLSMYIQKQEESVRGFEAVLGKLIKAKRMRDQVWEWCKTEGHVGEWSDGEDWVDAEAWGLAPDELKKGKDEEEVEGQEDTGRKGKRRRRD
ncbi:hypothetical protein PV08_08613 [Exophiala spinifera]|uniref:Transcriptional regulatory protein RXT2 N-terminal domain-containing protein n=1 Tax=Exophiala spinifera TaxID=91928 RepID=A0A0D2B413_9EURO|nr:uncharacterized protein PV08_08613 [Exophiala spinifera]KIW13425.1 hypothetical protein PV08_08613 [Exophiala spinifera]